MGKMSNISERDRVATELQYVTRHHSWTAKRECLGAIVDWHLASVAVARAEAWIPGSADTKDPVIEKAVIRFQQHQFNQIAQRLRDENSGLKVRLLAACGCIAFYAGGSADAGVRAGKTLRLLLSDTVAAGDPAADDWVL